MEVFREEFSSRQLLLILRRRWRLLAFVWLATIVVVALYTFTSTRLYRPQATLEIRPEAPVFSSGGDDTSRWTMQAMWEQYFQTQGKVLTSPSLLEKALKELPEAIRKDYEQMPDPVGAFGKHVTLEQARTNFLLKVGFVDPDPEIATQAVNTLVSVYVQDADQKLRNVKTSAAHVLSTETLPEIRKSVASADTATREFQTSTGFIDFEVQYDSLVETWKKVDGRLAETKLNRVRVTSEVDALKKYSSDISASIHHPAFHRTRSIDQLGEARAKLMDLIAKETLTLKPQHPRILSYKTELAAIEDKIKDAVQGTLMALRTDLGAAEEEEKALVGEQNRLMAAMAEVGRQRTEYRRLEAESVSAKELYSSYLKKQGDASAMSGAGLASVRVLDYARVPLESFRPRVLVNLSAGLLLGLLLGVAALLITHKIDNRILSSEETEAFVKLNVLAVVPTFDSEKVADKPAVRTPAFLDDADRRWEFESFRTLRSEVLNRLALEVAPGAHVLAVTSSLEREGKTTVSVNLARALALEGRRVLLFDADLRRPSVMQFASEQGAGLEEVLKGKKPLLDAVVRARIPGVDIVGLRTGIPGAAEIVGTRAFEAAIAAARESYDFVVIDTPPVMQTAESPMIARHADATLLVVREGSTPRRAATEAKRRLEGMRVKMLGAVHNCHTHMSVGYGYGYGYGYRYGYGYGYGYGRSRGDGAPPTGPAAPSAETGA